MLSTLAFRGKGFSHTQKLHHVFFIFHFLILIFLIFYFLLFKAAPAAYGNSQARGQIGAVAASLCHSHSNARSEPRL